MQLDLKNPIKVIKSCKCSEETIFKEEVFKEFVNSIDAIKFLKKIQMNFERNPQYERLHGLNNHLSVSFRNIEDESILIFYVSDEG